MQTAQLANPTMGGGVWMPLLVKTTNRSGGNAKRQSSDFGGIVRSFGSRNADKIMKEKASNDKQ